MAVATIKIKNEEYVILPKREFDRLVGVPPGAVEAVPFMARTLGDGLRAAREEAGLTQLALARKLRKSQAMVSAAENGTVRIGQRYVKAVLRACRLPEDWQASGKGATMRQESRKRSPGRRALVAAADPLKAERVQHRRPSKVMLAAQPPAAGGGTKKPKG